MHYLYRYVCILNVFFIYVYGQLSAIKNLLLYIINHDDSLCSINKQYILTLFMGNTVIRHGAI